MAFRSLIVVLLALAVALMSLPAIGQAELSVERVSGPDRYATAAAVAAEAFPEGADVAFVATGEDFPDALASGPAAAAAGAPVLLTDRTALPEATRGALSSLGTRDVVVLGGPAAVSGEVVAALGQAVEGTVERRFGTGRVETAAAVSRAAFEPGVPVAYVASGGNFPDALAGGAAAAVRGGPVLLVASDTLPAATAEELERLAPANIVVLGGTAAISDEVEEQLGTFTDGDITRQSGPDRFATSVAVSAATYPDGAATAYIATGFAPFDALAGAPAAARDGAPVLLVPRTCVPDVVREELGRLGAERLVLLGGTAAVDPAVGQLAACGRTVSTVTSALVQPWGAAVTPDGRVFVTERGSGRVLEVGLDGAVRTVTTVPMLAQGEGGLLGIATSPSYADDGLLYLYRTTSAGNEVVRFREGGPLEPVLAGIPRAGIHNGGRIAFGPDGMLYIGTGDASVPSAAQDPSSLGGKILRVTPDGAPAPENPTPGSPVYSLGHRNVQGLTWDASGRLYATEFGPGCNDEVNRIVAGGNYGWPDPSCSERTPGTIPPVIVRQPSEASWSGATFLVDSAVPEWEGDLFAAGLRGQRLWRFSFDSSGEPTGAEELLVGEYGRLRDAFQGPDGALYVLTGNGSNDHLLRIGP